MNTTCTLSLPFCDIYPMNLYYYQQSYQATLSWSNVTIQSGQSITFTTPDGSPQVIRLINGQVVTANDTVAVNLDYVTPTPSSLSFLLVVTLDQSVPYDMTMGLVVNIQITLPVLFTDANPTVTLTPVVATTNFNSPTTATVTCVTNDHVLQGSDVSVSSGHTYPTGASVTWALSGPSKREKLANGFKFIQNLTTTPSTNPAPIGGSGPIKITIGHQPTLK